MNPLQSTVHLIAGITRISSRRFDGIAGNVKVYAENPVMNSEKRIAFLNSIMEYFKVSAPSSISNLGASIT